MEIKTYKCDVCGLTQAEEMSSLRITLSNEDWSKEHICNSCLNKTVEAIKDLSSPPKYLTLDEHEGKHIGVVRIGETQIDLLKSMRIALREHYAQNIFFEAHSLPESDFDGKRIKVKLQDNDYSVHINIKETKLL